MQAHGLVGPSAFIGKWPDRSGMLVPLYNDRLSACVHVTVSDCSPFEIVWQMSTDSEFVEHFKLQYT